MLNKIENIQSEMILYTLDEKGETFFTDSTHKKANVNKNKYHEEIVKEVKKRHKWLEDEINVWC